MSLRVSSAAASGCRSSRSTDGRDRSLTARVDMRRNRALIQAATQPSAAMVLQAGIHPAPPGFPRSGVSIFWVCTQLVRQTVGAPLSPHVRGERRKVRGPNRFEQLHRCAEHPLLGNPHPRPLPQAGRAKRGGRSRVIRRRRHRGFSGFLEVPFRITLRSAECHPDTRWGADCASDG